MQILVRLLCGVAGVVAAFPAGLAAGCRVYEATGPSYAQCGYEFEGTEHVLTAIAIFAIVLGFFCQWFAGWLWRRFTDRER